jgi:hypothetical protein
MKRILTAFLALGALPALAQEQAADNAVQPSPYFVDGLKCEGLETRKVEPGWLVPFVPADAVSSAQRALDAGACEDLFTYFGIKRYTWIAPEDLEQLELNLKQSKLFWESSVTLQKSELKNHIYVVVRVKSKTSNQHIIEADARYYRGNGGAISDRYSHSLSYERVVRRLQPSEGSSYKFRYEGTRAATGANPAHPEGDGGSGQYSLLQGQWNWEKVIGTNLLYRQRVEFATVDNASRKGLNLNFRLEMPYRLDVKSQFGRFEVGPSVLVSSWGPRDASVNSWGLMPGLRVGYLFGDENENFAKYDFTWNRGVTGQSDIAHLSFMLQMMSAAWTDVFVNLGYEHLVAVDSILPEHRTINGSDRKKIEDLYVGIGKNFHSGTSLHQVALKLGTEFADYDGFDGHPAEEIGASHGYGGVGYKYVSEDWTVGLNARYVSGRTY